jgi:anti-sigma factor RsiW
MSCHASEEALERYCLGTCSEQELAALEEHLLVCHVCQDRALETELLVKPMRAALAERLGQKPSPAARTRGRRRSVRPAQLHLFLAPVVALFLVVLVLWHPFRAANAAPQVVALATFRGHDERGPAHAPGRAQLHLAPDLTGLPRAGVVRIEVIGADGGVRRQGRLDAGGHFPAGVLAPGAYWVRIYDTAGRLLREYALEVG